MPVALVLSTDLLPLVTEILDGYSIQSSETLPSDLTGYDVIIAANGSTIQGHMQEIETYVQEGGGYIYLLSAAGSSDLGTNHYWIGVQSYGLTGYGESASVSVDYPLGTTLQEGDLLKQQGILESGATWVNDLEPGGVTLAEYSGGNVFAYTFEHGAGRVYFQADTDHGIADDAEDRIIELLRAGIVWASGDPDLVSQSEPEPAVGDFLPDGTVVTTGNEPPSEKFVVVFDGVAPQSSPFPNPSDMTKAIFVTVTAQVVDAALLFNGEGQQYTYHVQPDSNALLRFPSELNVTDVTITTAGQIAVNGSEASGIVGYVTVKDPPSCSLPLGAAVAAASSIPDNSMQVGSAGSEVGSVLDVPDPLVPVSSLFAGFDDEDVTGFVVGFRADGLDYACPILPATMEILLDQPLVISDVRLENVGPWGEVGYESFDDATAYLRYNNSKVENLPGGLQLVVNATAPQEVYSADFAAGAFGTVAVTNPAGGNVQSIWISAGQSLVDPYLYFSAGDSWYSTAIDQSSNGTLLSFADDLDIDGLYVSVDDAAQDDRITIGYGYPIMVQARAGTDLIVEERQTVHLDGSTSTGPAGFSFTWTQVEGPTIQLQGANTATAYFSAPSVSESGARLVFKLAVVDDEGNGSEDTVVVRVTNEDSSSHPPSIATIEDSAVYEGDKVVLIASAYDRDGDTLTYSWTQNRGPLVVVTGANTAALSFNAPEVSSNTTLSFQLAVTDDEGRNAYETVLVVVRNLPEETVSGPALVLSAGLDDQIVDEGSLVVLNGSLVDSTGNGSYVFNWKQVIGPEVTLSNPAALNASFIAPQISEGAGIILTFQLDLLDEGNVLQSDQVSMIVNNTAAPVEVPVSNGEPEESPEQEPTAVAVVEPAFNNTVMRLDPEPPDQIYALSFQGSGRSAVFAPNPSGEIIGIWLNTTAAVSELELNFASSAGQQYFIDDIPINQTVAYVFNRNAALREIRLSAVVESDQVLQIGYYYGQFPVVPSLQQTQESEVVSESNDVLFPRPPEGSLIGWVSANTLLAGVMAIGIPTGIAITLKKVSDHRRRMSSAYSNPAKILFPKSDPIAGEAEKVRPVIEELEQMLGRNLDTALNASELLDRFGSRSSKADSAKQ
ncbi:MAG: PKD domain-containing protein [Nitrososphaera sp.]